MSFRASSFVAMGCLTAAAAGVAAGFGATGCAAVEERPRTEDDARTIAPLPACLVQLPSSGKQTPGVYKSLKDDQIWKLVFPAYDASSASSKRVTQDATACTGRKVLGDPLVAGGKAEPIEEGAVALGSGGDRLKVAWLRSLTYEDGTSGGALALLRSYEATAEVYAVGALRGRSKTLLAVERIGPEVVVVASDDGCLGRKARTPCEATVGVYAPRRGVLERLAHYATERVAYVDNGEPGVPGREEYRLTSAATFVDGGIRLLEQVMVRDEQGREVRKAELERSYTFAPDGSMVVSDDSLWGRVVPGAKPALSEVAAAAAPEGAAGSQN